MDGDQDGDGFTIAGGDCNDNDAAIFPGAEEICDEVDNNCDGAVDEGNVCVTLGFASTINLEVTATPSVAGADETTLLADAPTSFDISFNVVAGELPAFQALIVLPDELFELALPAPGTLVGSLTFSLEGIPDFSVELLWDGSAVRVELNGAGVLQPTATFLGGSILVNVTAPPMVDVIPADGSLNLMISAGILTPKDPGSYNVRAFLISKDSTNPDGFDDGIGASPRVFSADRTIHVVADRDGDGILDNQDACLDSDLSNTAVIDGCDTGVTNVVADNGCSIADLIAECANGVLNHGKFVSCVAHLTNELRNAGQITGQEKGAIVSCAAQSDIP